MIGQDETTHEDRFVLLEDGNNENTVSVSPNSRLIYIPGRGACMVEVYDKHEISVIH